MLESNLSAPKGEKAQGQPKQRLSFFLLFWNAKWLGCWNAKSGMVVILLKNRAAPRLKKITIQKEKFYYPQWLPSGIFVQTFPLGEKLTS